MRGKKRFSNRDHETVHRRQRYAVRVTNREKPPQEGESNARNKRSGSKNNWLYRGSGRISCLSKKLQKEKGGNSRKAL